MGGLSRHKWWALFAGAALALGLGLARLTHSMVDLERRENALQRVASIANGTHQIEDWLDVLLDREMLRPAKDYLAFSPLNPANGLVDGNLAEVSPLLNAARDVINLWFEVDPTGHVSSPGVPPPDLFNDAVMACSTTFSLANSSAALEAATPFLRYAELDARIAAANAADGVRAQALSAETRRTVRIGAEAKGGDRITRANAAYNRGSQRRGLNTLLEQSTLQQVSNQWSNPSNFINGETPLANANPEFAEWQTIGRLIPLWLESSGPPQNELFFVRRVASASTQKIQGFRLQWPQLRDTLLAEVRDLLPDAQLIAPHEETDNAVPAEREVGVLSQIPATLIVNKPLPGTSAPMRRALAIQWAVFAAALVAVGMTLRASIAFGERRQRFASAVTHELRTPLTTFRMYSEMLADGMVRDETQRKEYLETLRDESNRLAGLVENVLDYSRLERRSEPQRRTPIRVDQLLERAMPNLMRRAEDAEIELRIEADDAAQSTLEADAEAVGRVLFNLVDNACKYGRDPDLPLVRLKVERSARTIDFTVIDRGPGVSGNLRRRLFQPFEREVAGDEPIPGIGLGLALCRSLARELGGDLELVGLDGEPGAAFRLRLPRG